ncbi:PREDICTED: cilia- and flagella-associated protein 74 [Dipodomys ordii]|uniref:Cilia- and flagella-associated protein 74 n=1 Tax=Dipodomys ordii TaxID=10020 RepID=A0A1S3GDV0_DIPOR|nr:PREDICTED: cilia- and flagella-associated protein 74 [Dipodomys ordii]
MEEVTRPVSGAELEDSVPRAPAMEDQHPEQEDPEFEVEMHPRGAEMAMGPRPCGSAKEPGADTEQTKTSIQDRIQALRLRQTLELLDEMQEEKDFSIQRTREELSACRQRMSLLSKQQKNMAAQTTLERENNNMAAVGRLQAASRRLHTELENEEALQSRITATLKETQNAMWHIELKKGQFEDARKCVQDEAEAKGRRLQARTARQLHKEKEALGKAERNRLLRTRKSMHLQRELGLKHQKLLEDAQRNHKVAVKFLKASLGRIREREQKEETESREHMKRRMDAVLALKNNITANRETLRKFQAWGQARAELAEQKAQAEKELILAQGGDAFRHLIHQHRLQELEAQKRTFEEEQKLRRLEIVSKILKEEVKEENRKKKQHRPARTTECRTLRDKTWNYISNICEARVEPVTSHYPDEDEPPKHLWLSKALSTECVQVDLAALNIQEEVLAEPEIPGLWSEDYKPYQVPKEEVDQKPVGGTKMDRDILARTMEQLRSGIIHKQVVSGREFKGRPFNSKPEVIHFKDFDVGKVYKKKITLINATYTINYCKLVGVEETLRDFIYIDFDPPGPMSAGMSCEVLVTFKPMINKDLEGNVSFLAQTGSFSIPLKCSTKKCSLSLDRELIDFGSYTVGETTTQTITLTNTGGLGTKFKFLMASENYGTEDYEAILKMSSLFTFEDKSIYEKVITSFSETPFEGFESMADLPSRWDPEKQDEAEVTPVANGAGPNEEQMEITLGELTEGEIGPFSSIRVPIIFTPAIPGEVEARFKVAFKNPQSPTVSTVLLAERPVLAVGLAVDVPVWLPRPNVDLKICMFDRLYQDSILVHTRSKAALRLKFEVCKELRGHMELLPETGYIQAMSTYSVQLKFLPRLSLPEDAGKYFDKDSRVLEAPMTIRVADQIKPVEFTVQAIVTTSDLELNPSEVDFGYCTVYEAIRTEINLSNHSLLPQMFGFVGLPKFVDIQPNDGFGTIMPLETLQFDVIFQPAKAREYNFELVCKSEINRRRHTAPWSHLEKQEWMRQCRQRCLVQVSFRPVLSHEAIVGEAVQIMTKEMESKVFRKDTFALKKDLWKQTVSALQNDSSLPIKFWVQLESLSSTRAEARQKLPQFLTSVAQRTEIVGTQNHSGQSVFSVTPVEGLMLPGKAQDFTVTFSPDHESLYYSDRLQVVLFEKRVSHRILLQGAAREHMMFVEGGDALDVPVESLTVMATSDPDHREESDELKPILVTLDYVQLDMDTPAPPATRELHVGCIRTTQPSAKKTGEFSLDSLTWLQHKGFTIEPSRGSVERGQTKTISISWVPPADFDPDHPLLAWALLQLRGDVKETYKVIFVASVVTGP